MNNSLEEIERIIIDTENIISNLPQDDFDSSHLPQIDLLEQNIKEIFSLIVNMQDEEIPFVMSKMSLIAQVLNNYKAKLEAVKEKCGDLIIEMNKSNNATKAYTGHIK